MNKQTRSLIVVVSRPSAPERDDAVRQWEQQHAAALLEADIPGLVVIRRFELLPWRWPKPEGFNWDYERSLAGRFATFYESSLEDPQDLDRPLLSKGGLVAEGAELVHKGLYRFQLALHPDRYDPGKEYETNGITLALVHPRDEQRYGEWYVPVHLEDERRHGINHSVTRFLNIAPGQKPLSCVLLETDWPDMTEVRDTINKDHIPNFRYPAGITDAFEIYLAADYQRIP
jgi:hypothetical protein